jgi:large subunit ribosomal protein L21
MYAIFADGPRQYKVEAGQELDLDYRDLAPGSELKFDRVLALSNGGELQLGTPALAGASVTAKVVGVQMGEKLVIQKMRRRKNARRKTGHRQMYTRVKIETITG